MRSLLIEIDNKNDKLLTGVFQPTSTLHELQQHLIDLHKGDNEDIKGQVKNLNSLFFPCIYKKIKNDNCVYLFKNLKATQDERIIEKYWKEFAGTKLALYLNDDWRTNRKLNKK